jgi:HEAT repeat protein
MAKARLTEAKLAKLRLLRGVSSSPQLLTELRGALGDPSNLVVAEAAEIAGKARLSELAPELVRAFDRFLESPEKNDKLCRAKIAIAEALNEIDYSHEDFFWRGARYVQPESVWGGSQDTAALVRIACAFGLVRTRAHGALALLVDLLTDSEKPARVGAAQALAYSGTDAAGLLLRLKARVGDAEPDVIAECFSGLLKLAPQEAVSFVAKFLHSADSAVQESAILALGDSRRREAFEVLKSFWEKQGDSRLQEAVLMALALLRLAPATDFLLELVATGPEAVARAAVSALALHRYDDRLRERTVGAVEQRGSKTLWTHFEERFRANQ